MESREVMEILKSIKNHLKLASEEVSMLEKLIFAIIAKDVVHLLKGHSDFTVCKLYVIAEEEGLERVVVTSDIEDVTCLDCLSRCPKCGYKGT